MSTTYSARDLLVANISLALGAGMVEVELDPPHFQYAINSAINKLRQRSDSGNIEQDLPLHVTPDVQEYTLPAEVQIVRRLYRRGVGAYTNGGISFDPVDAAFYNIYLLQPNRTGGLATWDMYNQYLETTERVFASQHNFVWDASNHILRLIKRPTADEDIIVRCYVQRSEDSILTDPYTEPWIRAYAIAEAKYMLGQARGKFTSGFAGPNGTVQLNGDQLMQQAQAEKDKLEEELVHHVTSNDGYGFIIG